MAADEDALRLVNEFVAAINARDVKRLAQLMTQDHTFVDATGAVHAGRDTVLAGWKTFFETFAKYKIEVETLLAQGGVVAAFGWAIGSAQADARTGRSKSWRIPAAWKAVVKKSAIAEWQVCCDVEPLLRSTGSQRW